ncbi:MAG: RsmB/NOP family class I SAM-dependent RNA methyltransferase [Alphaproteobacteria bacterium]
MTPSARLQAAIEILDELEEVALPADRFLRDWFRRRRYAGSKDRADISERVYTAFRHRASLAWRMGSEGARSLVIASLLAEGKSADDLAGSFDGSKYAPPPLSEQERAAIAHVPENPPSYVQGEYPQWLEPELKKAFGDNLLDEMKAMIARAPVDLRVNTLKEQRDVLLANLRAMGVRAEATPHAPTGIRVPSGEGLSVLHRSPMYLEGAFEFQDEASQICTLLCAVKPGMRVLDLAAGAGGKSLALAAHMQNEGNILAFDDAPLRLRPLAERSQRAGARIITIAEKRGGPLWGDGKFEVVLVDAPCSGSGTWRRNPELKWRLTPEKLAGLAKLQSRLLEDGARHTKPGGRLVYATCSILPVENEERIEAFLNASPAFAMVDAVQVWREVSDTSPPPGMNRLFRASPRTTGTDGFFVCVMENRVDSQKGGH